MPLKHGEQTDLSVSVKPRWAMTELPSL